MSLGRYWRIVGCEARGRGALQLSEVHFYDMTGARVESSAAISSSITPAVGSLAHLNDDSLSAAVEFSAVAVGSPGFWVQWDFGAEVDIEAVRFGSGDGLATFISAVTVQRLTADGWVTVGAARQITYPGPYAVNPLGPQGTAATFLLTGDGAEGGTVVADASQWAAPVTVSGTVTTSATPSKFNRALKFDGAGHVYAQNPLLAFGTGDFTIEYWQWNNSASGDPGAFQISSSANGLQPSTDSVAVLWSASRWYMYCGGTVNSGVNHPGVNTWNHVALVRAAGVLSLFVNGVRIYQGNNNYNVVGQYVAVGGYYSTAYRFPGSIDDFTITAGVARYSANFDVPTSPASGRALLSTDGTFTSPARALALPVSVDGDDSGRNWITGTTRNTGTPETPVRRRVRLHDQRSGRLLRETWSNAATGAYVFPHLRAGTYYITAFDHTGLYGGVIETDVQSEPMP